MLILVHFTLQPFLMKNAQIILMNYDYEFTIPKTSDALVRGFGPWDLLFEQHFEEQKTVKQKTVN